MGIKLTSGLRNQPPAFWVNLGVRIVLITLLAFGAFSGLQQFEGRAFIWHLATYPIAAFVVSVIWAIRARDTAYPYAADILFPAFPHRHRRQCPGFL